MSKYSFKMDNSSVTFVINQLCKNPNLTTWEKSFMQSIKQHYIVENKFMSDKQYGVLSELWEKY